MLSSEQLHAVKHYLLALQKKLCTAFEAIDESQTFREDYWERPELQGGGLTCTLEKGHVLEKAAINFSHVLGNHSSTSASQIRPELADAQIEAMGVSLIIHPRNPYAPTTHANIRLFSAITSQGNSVWWFGGGFDLTPYYGFEEDCQHFHQTAKAACDPFGEDVYTHYKQWADNYFYLKHRNEQRGIGGIFFDDLNTWGFDRCFEFMRSVGDHFLLAYEPILIRRKDIPYGERERAFQQYRRGRYVEFNLLYDRGTQFGLKFGGRVESILASLPPIASWQYNWQPEPNSPESALIGKFLIVKDWLTY